MASDRLTRRRPGAAPLLAMTLALSAAAATGEAQAQGGPAQEASAADKETARQLMDEGDAAFASQDYATALEKYRGADRIMGVPTTTFEVGKTLEAMGELVEARDAYLRVVRYTLPKPNKAFAEAKVKADRRAADLAGRIGTLKLTIEGVEDDVELEVLIDGTAVSAAGVGQRSVNPGDHRIVVRAPGYREGSATFSLGEGETKAVTITLEEDPTAGAGARPSDEPPPPTPPSTPAEDGGAGFPIWATVGFSVGAVGIGLGAAFGILSLGKAGDLEEACPDRVCVEGRGLEGTQDDAILFANLSNVGFILGGVGAAFGVVALFTLDVEDDAGETALVVEPSLGPGYLGVGGRF